MLRSFQYRASPDERSSTISMRFAPGTVVRLVPVVVEGPPTVEYDLILFNDGEWSDYDTDPSEEVEPYSVPVQPTHRLLPDGGAVPIERVGYALGKYAVIDPTDPAYWKIVGEVKPVDGIPRWEALTERVERVPRALLQWALHNGGDVFYGEQSVPLPGSTLLPAWSGNLLSEIQSGLLAAIRHSTTRILDETRPSVLTVKVESILIKAKGQAVMILDGCLFNVRDDSSGRVLATLDYHQPSDAEVHPNTVRVGPYMLVRAVALPGQKPAYLLANAVSFIKENL